jgi:hypothetical protein
MVSLSLKSVRYSIMSMNLEMCLEIMKWDIVITWRSILIRNKMLWKNVRVKVVLGEYTILSFPVQIHSWLSP